MHWASYFPFTGNAVHIFITFAERETSISGGYPKPVAQRLAEVARASKAFDFYLWDVQE